MAHGGGVRCHGRDVALTVAVLMVVSPVKLDVAQVVSVCTAVRTVARGVDRLVAEWRLRGADCC